jgi:hypothetical protein
MIRKVMLGTALATLMIIAGVLFRPSHAQVLTARPDEVRFQMVTNEPIAAPDRRSVVAGASAMVIKDQRTGQCYLVVTVAQSTSMAPAAC